MSFRLTEIAERFGARLSGVEDTVITGVGTLQSAGPGQIAFLANPAYRKQLAATGAGAVILREEYLAECPVPALITENPYLLYARVAGLFEPRPAIQAGISPAAHVAESATTHSTASVAAGAFVGPDVELAENVVVGPNCVVEQGARVGAGTRLSTNVTLCRDVSVGARCLLHPGVVIGGDGFGLARDSDGWLKVPQLGSVRIGDDVEIGANTTIDRGALEDTVIEDGVKLDNQIQIAHNVHIGAHTAIAGCTAVAGSTRIGANCMIAGAVGIAGHLTICDGVTVLAMTLVSGSIDKPGVYAGSLPVDEVKSWRRNSVRYRRLDELARRVAALEKVSRDKEK